MRKILLSIAAFFLTSVAQAQNYQATQGAGTTFGTKLVSAVNYPQFVMCDPTTPAQCVAVDSSGRMSLVPNQAINNAQINGVTPLMGNGVTGTGSQRVTIASDNTAFAVNAAATLNAETTKVIGTTRNLGNAGGILDFAGQNAASPASAWLMGCQFNTSPTTITSGNASPCQLDNAGNLKVNVITGGAGGGAVYGPQAVGVANANPPVVIGGTTTGAAAQNVVGAAVKLASTAPVATDTSLVVTQSPNSPLSVAVGAQADSAAGSATATASLIALVKYLNTQASTPLDNSSVAINVSTATTTQLVALSGATLIRVTSFDVIAGGTGNITFVYGTGTNCGTGTTSLTGPYNLTAQAGIAKGSGIGTILKVPSGNALCVTTSAAVQMSGSVSFQQF